jgi:hypothetical protein
MMKKLKPPLHLTPATRDRATAEDWFRRFEGAGLDGVIAKPVSGTYQPNKRVMFKVKHERECDCVVAGFRWHKRGEKVRCGFTVAWTLRRRRTSPARWRLRQLHQQEARRAGEVSRAVPEERAEGTSVAAMG